MTSLRRRLMLTLLVGLFLGGVIGAVSIYRDTIEELSELFDDRLQTLGDNLTPQTLDRDAAIENDEVEDEIVVQLWGADGRLRFTSNQRVAPPIPITAGMVSIDTTGEDWRSYARRVDGGGFLQVAQAMSERQEAAAETAFRLLLPFMVLMPVLAAYTAWAVSRQLRPLRALADQLRVRGVKTQSIVVVDDAPLELVPVVSALNELLDRQADASRQQRAFLADAAHELRTPLAVVSLQAQRARQAVSHSERREALDALKAGVDRATRLVTQLLALARSEGGDSPAQNLAPVDLEHLLKTVLAELHPLAAQRQLDLGLTESVACVVNGDSQSLRSLIVNLLDNAIRYTPTAGRIDVVLGVDGTQATLRISDTGPGIPQVLRQQVFERFMRGGMGDSGGTGLGLAIARQVAERHGGTIALEDAAAGAGLSVRVVLPVAG